MVKMVQYKRCGWYGC